MLKFNSIKRVLEELKKGSCEEKNRNKLADCAPGFACGTTGGKGAGTLRHAVTQTGPLWITFKGSMTIKLEQELIVTSDKTIDMRYEKEFFE
ncbi:hypothetical protein PVK06_017245 [Gossypium arboreum]|uniref:Uncharacterized protein n=1 Tax=Gossypium arboreum TaxID=29729 RepID=A0ABR0Q2X2_GOSAR|nr:hypothetical protein PVK06_017245 [Gossypium arboreum]